MEMALLKELLTLALADIIHKNNYYSRAWRRLSSVCTKLELARSKSNEIPERNVLQKFSPHAASLLPILFKAASL